MIKAIGLALGQLTDRSFRGVLWRSVGLAALAFVLLWGGVGFLLTHTALFSLGWLDTVVDLLGGVAVLVLTWFLFPAVIGVILGFFLEDAASAVDRRHYPHLPPARAQPIAEIVVTTLKFLGIALALNLVALLFLVIPPLFPFVFYGINGYLLGREYYELVALRRLDPVNALGLKRTKQVPLLVFGVIAAFAFTVPFVNLVTPLLATAAMVHLVEMWRQRSA